jgi:hypothetical protein
MFTDNEMILLNLVSEFRNYDNLESEISDNAVGVYFSDITEYTSLNVKVARGVVSSLIQKDILVLDDVNGTPFYRATDKCLEYCYNILDNNENV